MIFNHDFFCKVSIATLALVINTLNTPVYAADPVFISTRQETLERTRMSTSTNVDAIVSLCPAGQYVYKCGNYRVGFNWLKSATLPDPVSNNEITTKNYHVGNDVLELFEQMRTFFGHNANTVLSYYDSDDNIQSAQESVYASDREAILNNLCHPSNSVITCAPCPNSATVQESVVGLDDDNLTVRGTWQFFTIADCYMQEFEDSTGSYFYVPDEVQDPSNLTIENGEKCFYTNTNPDALSTLNGDAIGTFIPGLNLSRTNTETLVSIPSVNSNKKKR